jgi:L-ascorbate metabolism protein UlaG (beta-lactamase superfamily)
MTDSSPLHQAATSDGHQISVAVRYFGWSALSVTTEDGVLLFDPFFRPYCGAEWFHLEDFENARYICVTHGHEEHFLDVPAVAKASGATVIGSPSVCRFLKHRNGIAQSRLCPLEPSRFESVTVPGYKITALPWKHRDVNLVKALTKAVFHGNATQLKWAFHSATSAPFYAPYTGFHLELPSGISILNYNEGFNSKMTDEEIRAIGLRFTTDILLAGMQLDFVDDVVRGVRALNPKIVVLYPPHENFHAMMGVTSTPWTEFAEAVSTAAPNSQVHIAAPGSSYRFTHDPSGLLAAA